jgi:thiamine-monophosphate kinase
MDEFALIDAVVAALGASTRGPGIVLGPGDDCSIAELPAGTQLVSSIDTLVAGVHFPIDAPGGLIGHRALGVSVSDLAAMGATPLHAIVSITLEDSQQTWLIDFARGMGEAAGQMGIAVVGGNLARGPLNIAVSVHGVVPKGGALLRSGARPDDRVFVSGCVGAAGLDLARLSIATPTAAHLRTQRPGDRDYALARYYLPSPRIDLGVSLRGIASAAIDVSDGLSRPGTSASRAGRCADQRSGPCGAGGRSSYCRATT